MDRAGRAVALLGDDDLGLALGLGVFVAVLVLVVVAVAVDEGDDIGVLLDGAGLAEIGQQGRFLSPPRCSEERESWDRATTGTRISLARALRPRETAETSWVRFSNFFWLLPTEPVMSWR